MTFERSVDTNGERWTLTFGTSSMRSWLSERAGVLHENLGIAAMSFAAMQSETGAALLKKHGLDPEDPVSLLYLDGKKAYTDSDAIVRVLDALGGWFELANLAFGVPRFVRDPVYRLIARNRYRWFGRRDACRVPDAATRDRFLS